MSRRNVGVGYGGKKMVPLMKTTFLHEQKTKEELAAFILTARKLSMGEECAQFEEAFGAYQGAKEAVLFNSGSSANVAMLQTLMNVGRLKAGDRVGFSALTWSTNVMPIIQFGMEPVTIDCEPRTLNVMSEGLLRRLRETDMRALFITNALGFAGDLHVIKEICEDRGIILIEDNCEALGTELQAGRTGSFGEMASFSFFVAHHMSTVEGGMVCTDDEELGEMLRIVRANGWDRNLNPAQQGKWRRRYGISSEFDAKYTFYDLAFNFRPTEITGFLGQRQLAFLKDNVRTRERTHMRLEPYVRANPDLIALDHSHISVLSAFAFPVLCTSAEVKARYVSRFAKGGVEIRPVIAGNIQKQPFYRKHVAKEYDLPGADMIHTCGFYCGNYPELTEGDIRTLCKCLRKKRTVHRGPERWKGEREGSEQRELAHTPG